MAGLVAKAVRNQEARDSLQAVVDRLSARLAIEPPPPMPGRVVDPDLVPIMQLERFRDMLLLIEAELPPSLNHGPPDHAGADEPAAKANAREPKATASRRTKPS